MISENLLKTIMKLNNILILGNGYMGNYIQKHLEQKGLTVTKKSSSELNYHDQNILYKYLLNNDITTLINCSGFTGRPNIDEAETKKELCWELNVMSPLRVNKLCDLLNVNYIHISSGCIYDGYEKEWSERDSSNYGLFTNHSSFYSKSKHAFELLSQDLKGTIIRIRMPFGPDDSHRNYIHKIARYENLIDFKNSKTYIPDLCEFVSIICNKYKSSKEYYNVVNPNPMTTKQICDIMREYGFHNVNWKFVTLSELQISTSRSNCVLNGDKANDVFKMKTEEEALRECFEIILEKQKDYQRRSKEIEDKYGIQH